MTSPTSAASSAIPSRTALVLGAGGFIGSHMVKRLKSEGYWVRGVDLKYPEYGDSAADEFVRADLRDLPSVEKALRFKGSEGNFFKHTSAGSVDSFDEIYQFAADMGGAGFVFTGENDADIMHNSATINLNVLEAQRQLNEDLGKNKTRIFYSGSACMYPEHNQLDPDNPNCEESSAYPADPDSEYGWEKLFSERLYLAYGRNYKIPVRIARYHNIFGVEGTWDGGREKAPAAICRKVGRCADGGTIEVWGNGQQTRSFLYVDECIEGTRRLMQSDFTGPVNIGSDEMISINNLVRMVAEISGKTITISNIPGPTGVKGRNSDNRLIKEKLGWAPSRPLVEGMRSTYGWIGEQIAKKG